MVVFYFCRVKDGKTTLSKVPKPLREDVKQMLLDNGYGYLIKEG